LPANISYDIDDSVKFDTYKDTLTDAELAYVKDCSVDIIDEQIKRLKRKKEQFQA